MSRADGEQDKLEVVRGLGLAVDVHLAAERLKAGELVIVPTETVYGVAALVDDEEAISKLLAVKRRPPKVALPVLAPSIEEALPAFAPGEAKKRVEILGTHFWPGALTLVAPVNPAFEIDERALAFGSTVGVRVPAHDVTRSILIEVGKLVCCPSANRSGEKPPTATGELDPGFLLDVGAFVEGGAGEGAASTVVEVSDGIRVLRAGAISYEEIAAVLARRHTFDQQK